MYYYLFMPEKEKSMCITDVEDSAMDLYNEADTVLMITADDLFEPETEDFESVIVESFKNLIQLFKLSGVRRADLVHKDDMEEETGPQRMVELTKVGIIDSN